MSTDDIKQREISLFIKNLAFLVFYFVLILMIASFGLIAEA
jgi:uncharacterized membrane protein (DUF485 family)